MTEPRYETAYEQLQRTGRTHSVVCMDCGVFVMDTDVHDRFHSILSGARRLVDLFEALEALKPT
jgi:hypothetical protein